MAERRKLWTDALRSGYYEQAQGSLQVSDKFCCLGVLCEVAEENGIKVNRTNVLELLHGSDLSGQHDVMNWVGLRRPDGSYAIEDDINGNSLVAQNDFADKSFIEIADIIDSEPEGLFV